MKGPLPAPTEVPGRREGMISSDTSRSSPTPSPRVEWDPSVSPAERASFAAADAVIVLPTLNEEHGLAATLKEIPIEPMIAAGWNVRRLVIDGRSTDRTRQVAHEWGVPVLLQRSKGKGAAIREALDFLAGERVRYAVILDADCTYPGGMVPAMVQLLDAGSQLVIGVRQPTTSAKDNAREFIHRVGNRVLNLTASQLAGLPILDLCSGFWSVNVQSVPALHLESDGFEIEAELFTKSYRAGYTVTQIPISYRDRVGVAKLNALRDGARILLTTVRFGRRRFGVMPAGSPPSRLRDFLTVTMVHDARDIRVVADASRRYEAELLAQRIRASRPGARVEIWTAPSTSPRERAPAADTAPTTMTISLPAAVGDHAPESVVHLPRTGRIVAISETPRVRPSVAVSGGYRLEYAPHLSPALDRVRAIVANTFPTERAKELAFLGANGQYGTLSVWRTDVVAPPSTWTSGARPTGPEARGSESPSTVLVDEGLP